MSALERLRALRNSENAPTEALTELTKGASVSFVSTQVPPFPEVSAGQAVLNAQSVTDASDWLARVAGHLHTTPTSLIASRTIDADEVPHYLDRDPIAVAEALRRTWPQRFADRADNAPDDDRRHCNTCMNLNGTRCRARGLAVIDDMPRRCTDDMPKPGDTDQRPGRERWPSMLSPVDEFT